MTLRHFCATIFALSLFAAFTPDASADPLPGQKLKFLQVPLNAGVLPPGVPYPLTTAGTLPTPAPFPGHDELSTVYNQNASNAAVPPLYTGEFMADDFSDTESTPVVHLQWWGSYPGQSVVPAPAFPVQKFAIAWESDVPNPNPLGYSYPGQLLQAPEIATRYVTGPLVPGQFTEVMVSPPGHPEPVFQYNLELQFPFPEQAGQVYWLKIVALDDTHAAPSDPGTVVWGWHDRDWTIHDPLASVGLPSPPGGEHDQGPFPGTTQPIWHFQDDAVSGRLSWDVALPLSLGFQQVNMVPEHYRDFDDGPQGIGNFSKDLAFALYTIPEPSSVLLMATGCVALAWKVVRRRRTA